MVFEILWIYQSLCYIGSDYNFSIIDTALFKLQLSRFSRSPQSPYLSSINIGLPYFPNSSVLTVKIFKQWDFKTIFIRSYQTHIYDLTSLNCFTFKKKSHKSFVNCDFAISHCQILHKNLISNNIFSYCQFHSHVTSYFVLPVILCRLINPFIESAFPLYVCVKFYLSLHWWWYAGCYWN